MGWPFIQGTMAFRASFSILCSITAKMQDKTSVDSHFEINFVEGFCPGTGQLKASATFLWAATRLWTAGAADVAAALLWATLTAAYAEEHDEQESTQDDQQHCQPICNTPQHSHAHMWW